MSDSTQTTSIIDELRIARGAAGTAYLAELEAYEQNARRNGTVGFIGGRTFADAFDQTEKGAELRSAWDASAVKHRAALYFAERGIYEGNGTVYHLRDVRPEACEVLYRAAADHGIAADSWPKEVRESVARTFKDSPRQQTFEEYAARRHQVIERAHLRGVIDRMLDAKGLDPSSWTDADLDELVAASQRAELFSIVRQRAQQRDPEWNHRKTEVQP